MCYHAPVGVAENIAWLRGLYARFDEDVKLLHRVENAWLPCKKCPDGHCCGRNSFISLQRRSNPFALEDWWLMLDFVRRNFSAEDKKQLARNIISKGAACIFLFKNRCSLYTDRPWGSRIHPYVINFSESGSLFPEGKIALPSLPGPGGIIWFKDR